MTDELTKRRVVIAVEKSTGITAEELAPMVGGMPAQIREAMLEGAELAVMIHQNEQSKAEEEERNGLNPKLCCNACCDSNELSECVEESGPQGCLYRMTEPPPNHLSYPSCKIPTHAEALRMLSRAGLLEPDEYGMYNGTDYAFHAGTKRLWFALVRLLVKHGEIDPKSITPEEEKENENYLKSSSIELATRLLDKWAMELAEASPVLGVRREGREEDKVDGRKNDSGDPSGH